MQNVSSIVAAQKKNQQKIKKTVPQRLAGKLFVERLRTSAILPLKHSTEILFFSVYLWISWYFNFSSDTNFVFSASSSTEYK